MSKETITVVNKFYWLSDNGVGLADGQNYQTQLRKKIVLKRTVEGKQEVPGKTLILIKRI